MLISYLAAQVMKFLTGVALIGALNVVLIEVIRALKMLKIFKMIKTIMVVYMTKALKMKTI